MRAGFAPSMGPNSMRRIGSCRGLNLNAVQGQDGEAINFCGVERTRTVILHDQLRYVGLSRRSGIATSRANEKRLGGIAPLFCQVPLGRSAGAWNTKLRRRRCIASLMSV